MRDANLIISLSFFFFSFFGHCVCRGGKWEDRDLQWWGQLKKERRGEEEKIFPLAILFLFRKGTTFLTPYPS